MAVAAVVAEAMAAAAALLLSRGRWWNLVGILSVPTGRLHGLCTFCSPSRGTVVYRVGSNSFRNQRPTMAWLSEAVQMFSRLSQ